MSNGLFDAHAGTQATNGSTASELPIAIIGAGPVSLAAAAHLVERRMSFILFEAGPRVGHSAGLGPRATVLALAILHRSRRRALA